MICRTCLRRATGLSSTLLRTRPSTASAVLPSSATQTALFTTGLRARNAAAVASESPSSSSTTPNAAEIVAAIQGDAAAAQDQTGRPVSSCPAGTVLTGLNYFKGKTDPVALPDEEYPEWLWRCLEVKKTASESGDAEAGDEFSKSKKQRRLAAKRQRQLEAKARESGDLDALIPKIPLQKQSVNLPGTPGGDVVDAVAAADAREELRKAMRKERRAGIKESNYLKSM
ncbi:Mitochondrial ribosomal protein L37 domain containing protein [Naviculisporaceae sp. PSN 640]